MSGRKKLALAAALLAGGSLVAASVAWSVIRPSLGELANSIAVNSGKFESEDGEVELKTKEGIRIRTAHTGLAAGVPFSSGWHTHPGPVLVAVKEGTLTFTGPATGCAPLPITAGNAFIELPNTPLIATATGEAEWVTTFLLPADEPFSTPVGNPC